MKQFYSNILRTIVFCSFIFSVNFSSKAQVGSVLDFDGVDDYVNLGALALKPTTGLTAEVWINMGTWGGNHTFLGNTEASGYALFMQGGNLQGIVRRLGTYGVVSIPASSISPGWHHIALTYDGRYTNLYLDANLVSTDDAGVVTPITYIANNTYFGAEASTILALVPQAGFYFQGQMDEVRIWNYARSQCQIYTNRGCEIPGAAPGLLGNYHFNQGTAGGPNGLTLFLNDASGNLNSGGLNNFTLNFGSSNWLTPGPFGNGFTTTAPSPTVTTGQEYSVTIVLPNGQTNVSDWTPWITNFADPLPGGAIVTGMNLQLNGVDQGWGGSGYVAPFYAGGEFIGNSTFSHSWQTFNMSTTKPFPYYNYGGMNPFIFYFAGWPGWQGFISNISLTIRYNLIATAPVVVCQNSTTVLNGYGATSYSWSGGITDGVPFVVNASQNYTVTGLVFGCVSSNTVQVNAIPAPTITSITGGTFLCEGSALTLSMNTSGAVSNYSWTSGAVTSSAVVAPLLSTTYTASATNASGCSHTATTAVTVATLPVVSVTSGSICTGSVFSINPSGAVSYTYSSGSNTVAPVASTSYTVGGVDGLGCASLPVVVNVTVDAIPTVAVNSGTICFGNSFTLSPSGAVSYTYLSGSTVVSPTSSSTYSIIGRSFYGCLSSNTAIATVSVNPLPVVSITTPTAAVCNGGAVTLTGNSADTYTWTGGISNGVAFTPTASATYSVNGTNTLTGCTGTNNAAITVTVHAIPVISVPNYTLCSGNSVSLVPTGASNYTYSGGAALVSPLTNTTYAISGTSSVGCVSSVSAVANVTVYALPTVSVNSGAICFGNSLTLTPTGVLSYTFLTGSTVVSPSSSSTYSVIGRSAVGCLSSNTAVATVSVNPLPVVSITTPTAAVCNGGAVTLSGNSADTYTWTGGISNGVAFTPTASATYSVNGTNTLTGCTGTNNAAITVTVHAIPVISVPNYTLCSGNSVSLVPTGASTYTYSGGAALVSPLTNTTYAISGTSSVGCVSSASAVANVTVYALPTVSVNSGAICFGNSLTLTPTGALSYTFLTGSTVVSPSINSNYSVIGRSAVGCLSSNTAVATVSVNPLPVVSITTPTAAVCNGGAVTLSGNSADTYTWTGGISNGVAFTPTASATYSVNGTNTLTGCTGTNNAAITVTVHAIPVISVPNYTLCSGNSVSLVPTGASTYTYSGGAALVSPLTNTTYAISGTSSVGCVSSVSAVASVTVYGLPTVAINSGSICEGQSFTLVPSGAFTYTVSGGSFVISPSISSDYTLTGTSTEGCLSTNLSIASVTVHNLPLVAINTSTNALCTGGTATLSALNAFTYTWNPGNLNAGIVNVNPTATTVYTLVGTSTAGCTSTNAPVQAITVYTLPLLSTGTASTAVCLGASGSLSVTGASSYTWDPGNLSGSSILVAPLISTAYTVSGTSAMGCLSSNTLVGTVTVNPLPNIGLSASQSTICFGFSTTLTASGTDTYVLNPGGLTGSSFTLSPGANTNYSLSGTNTLTGCSSNTFATLDVTVHPLPLVAITSNSTVLCFGESAVLSGNNASTYTWQPVTFIGQTQTVTPGTTTTYTLNGTSAFGCTNTNIATQVITVNQLPVVGASALPAVVCLGNSLTLVGSGADTYTWSGGALNGVAFAPTISDTYTVNGSNTLTGCSSTNSAVQSITVNALPVVSVNSSTNAVCMGFSTTLNGVGAATYAWSHNVLDGVAFSPSVTQQYTVTGTSALGCTNTAVHDVTVYALPVVSVTASQTVLCIGDALTLSGSGADTYTWTPAISNAVTFTPSLSETYTVVGSNTLTGCTSTNLATQFILVNNLPVVTASVSNPVICFGFTTMLSGGGANTYTWTGGANDASFFTPAITSDYTVTGTDNNGCKNTAVSSVTVNALPILTVSSTHSTSCSGETIALTVNGANTYTWNGGNNANTFSATLNVSTTYTVSGTNANNCVNSATYTQMVDPCAGVVNVVPLVNNVTCKNKQDGEIELQPEISYAQNKVYYFWLTPELCADSTCSSLKKLKAGNYPVRIRVEYSLSATYSKIDTIELNVVVEDVNPPCPLTVYNGLTPNGDGVNDVFYIENIASYLDNKVSMYNRWGVKMGEVEGYNNLDKSWPLEGDRDKVVSGTYFYIIDLGDGTDLQKGWIEVFKN